MASDCCNTEDHNHDHHKKPGFDYVLWGSTTVITLSIALYYLGLDIHYLEHFAHTVIEFLGKMWWGIVIGLLFVGLMNKVPREYFQAILGRGDTAGGIIRAAIAGIFLDLCSHGILMVGAKLYERGASIAQVMTFLIASPWNSLSLTIIMISLIGLQWTLVFIAASAVIAIITGFIYMAIIKAGLLPDNPNKVELPEGFSLKDDAKKRLKGFKLTGTFFIEVIKGGMKEARMLLRWLLLGVVLAAAIRAFVPTETFAEWFGPTLFGLVATLVATTIIEVCSEGSAPIASEIFNQAGAPGNAFAFLMAGVSTDYTEIMVLKDATKSWKMALSLPLVTVPQVLLLGYIMNMAGG